MIDRIELQIKEEKEKYVVKTLPKGKVYIEKYDKYFDFCDDLLNELADNVNNPDLAKPFIDKNHEKKESYGDIISAEVREDGLYTFWDLNEEGKKAIKNRLFRYISPEFGNVKDQNGKMIKNVLIAVTLTNIPALRGGLPQLQEQITLENKNKKEVKSMENEKLQLEMLQKTTLELEAVKKEKIELQTELEAVKKQKDDANKQLIDATQKLNQIELEQTKKEAKEFVKEKIELQIMNPKQAEYWELEYIGDPEKTVKAFEGIEGKKEAQITTPQQDSCRIELSAEDKKKMKLAGLDVNSKEDAESYLAIKEAY